MGNVKITALPKAREYTRKFAFADLHLDLDPTYTTANEVNSKNNKKDLKVDYDLAAIKNSIVNIMTTSPGEKILNPTFGIDLRDILFEPVTESGRLTIVERIQQGLILQEPRIKFNRSPVVSYNEDDLSYSISLYIDIPLLEISDFLLEGLLNYEGFTVINNNI